MSLEYCHDCEKMIDLDVDEHFYHFQIQKLKGGKENDRRKIN